MCKKIIKVSFFLLINKSTKGWEFWASTPYLIVALHKLIGILEII